MSPVEEKVRQIVVKVVRKQDTDFTPTSTFKDLGADSLDIVQVLVAIEDAFEIEMVDEEMKEITNMEGLVAYVEKKVAAKAETKPA
jgi:acyl carrier protein